MRALLAVFLFLAVAVGAHAQAQPRTYSQAELDALLAPVALYPDPLLSQVLVASTYPDDVREAAAWLRNNPNLRGDDALRAAEPMPWDPSVKTLLAYPDLLERMAESPQWLADLGTAFLNQEPHVMDTVQALRRRAQAAGHLQSDGYQSVIEDDRYVVVQPVYSHIAYVPWYNPLVVYGPWWWHSHHPIAWRPWHVHRPAIVSVQLHHHYNKPKVDWRHRQVTRPTQVHRPIHVTRPGTHITRPQKPPERRSFTHAPIRAARPIIQSTRIVEDRGHPRIGARREHRVGGHIEHRVAERGRFDPRGGGQARGHGNGRR